MIRNSISFIANYLWRESIKNLQTNLSTSEFTSFTSNDYYYLTTIYYMEKPRLSDLANALNLTKPAISAMVRKLSKLGLIERIQSEQDKRVYYLTVTSKGQNIIGGDEALYERFEKLIYDILGDEDKFKCAESMFKDVVDNLDK